MKSHPLFFLCFLCFIIAMSPMTLAQEVDQSKPSGRGNGTQDVLPMITLAVSTLECSVCKKKAELWYTEAFRRLGYRFSYELYPSQRSLVEANSGVVDGMLFV